MDQFTTRSKYVPETITVSCDFADVLPVGTSIQGSPTITVGLDTGTDTDPQNILYLGTSIHGARVDQRFRLGIPGTIYSITWKVYNGTEYFEKETYLAILPSPGDVTPNYQYMYLTSDLYPLEVNEQLTIYFLPVDGTFNIGQTWMTDSMSISFLPDDGDFQFAQQFYTSNPDEFQVSFLPIDGEFNGAQVFYTCQPEEIQLDFSPLDGSLTPGQVFYTTKPEEINIFFTPLDGTFT